MTVTVCGVFQLAAVKVRLAGETVPSRRVAATIRPIVTLAVGWLFSTTVNVAVPPASRRRQAAGRRDRDPGRVVVRVGDRHVGRVQRRCSSASALVAAAVTIV